MGNTCRGSTWFAVSWLSPSSGPTVRPASPGVTVCLALAKERCCTCTGTHGIVGAHLSGSSPRPTVTRGGGAEGFKQLRTRSQHTQGRWPQELLPTAPAPRTELSPARNNPCHAEPLDWSWVSGSMSYTASPLIGIVAHH